MGRPGSSRHLLLAIVIIGVAVANPQTGTARERCPNTCPDTVRPVCATNNLVYRNECELFRAACLSLPGLGKLNDGPCVVNLGASALGNVAASALGNVGASAVVSPTSCREECNKIYLPVCGTDGVTYNNKCLLEAESCKRQEKGGDKIEIFNDNACAGFTGTTARRPSTDGQRIPVAPPTSSAVVTEGCPDTCNGGFRPVCGTNNLTYGSDCYLELAKCRIPGLQKKADGVCTKDCSLQCDTARRLVCGTDGITYTNDCFLLLARCKDPAVQRAHDGQCVFVEKPECAPRRCPSNGAALCGSDGITYRNRCLFDAAVCYNQGLLKLYDGPCKH